MKMTKKMSSLVRAGFAQYLGKSHQGNRDLYQQFGYPQLVSVTELSAMYKRNDIANRIIKAFPQATWRDAPIIRDDAGSSPEKGTDEFSPFVASVDSLFRKMSLFSFLERADRVASIGRFGALVMGFQDGRSFDQPMDGKAKLAYVAPYGETSIQVTKYVEDKASPRFGKPELYTVSQTSLDSMVGTAAPVRSFVVHHSRVIHIAECLEEDEVYGTPRLLPVYNRLKDLEKVVGGGAEVFWLTASRGLAITADPEINLTEEDIQGIKDQADEFQHQLRRYLVAQGVQFETLAPESPDPEPNATVLLDLIAGASGVPKRILLGTERGELASSQDENNFNARIAERRNSFAAPFIAMPLINKLIETGNVEQPQGEYWVEWPKGEEQTPDKVAAQATQISSAISTYVNSPGSEFVVPIAEFREKVLRLDPQSEYETELPEDIDETAVDDPALPVAGGETVQDTALNGAQVTSLKEIVQAVADGSLPAESALHMIMLAFPSVSEEKARAILSPLANFEPKPEPAKAPPPFVNKKTPLYVHRKVKNVSAIHKWAKENGIKGVIDDLHVTLCYSKEPVDWQTAEEGRHSDNLMIDADPHGRFLVNDLGDTTLALTFSHDGLEFRHRELRDAGATHGWDNYVPHITLSYEPQGDLSKVKPYDGAIVLGPEVFKDATESD